MGCGYGVYLEGVGAMESAEPSYAWIPGCSTCVWSESHSEGLFCRFWRTYAYKRCNEWEKEVGADEREDVE